MTLTTGQRQIVLGCVLALTVAVTAVFGDDEPLPVEPQVAPMRSVQPKAPPATESRAALITLDKLNRTPPATEGTDIFAAKSWSAPPPPPPPPMQQAKPSAPPKPTAPQLPFRYVGQIEGKDGLLVFLVRGGDLLSAKPGELLDLDYRIEAVTPELITFVYVPLGERQSLSTGGK